MELHRLLVLWLPAKEPPMGRRSLPKIDPSVSIEDHFTELDDVETPWSPDEFFGRSGPLEIEIGCGKGLYLLNASGQHPEKRYLGVEISHKYGQFAAYHLVLNERQNAQIIRGDAMQFMHDYVGSNTAAAVHIYFPDPWWKERHRRRRVVNPQVVKDIERVLQPTGTFHFWTDVAEYYHTACQTIVENSDFQGPLEVPERAADHDMDYRTHFERRMRLNDHPVYRAQFKHPAAAELHDTTAEG